MLQKSLRWLMLCTLVLSASTLTAQQVYTGGTTVTTPELLSLNKGWRFHLGDIPFPEVSGHSSSYNNAKAGKASGAAAPGYDDASWRQLNLPHDWAVEGPFDKSANMSQGYRPRGIGWYRRDFKLDPSDRGKNLEIRFDGIATYCTVWFNGSVVHRNWCGYTSFYIDITPMAKYGDELNNISVRVDAVSQEGWWYEGAGIYRNTWLVKRSPVHIASDGVFANPVKMVTGSWVIPGEVNLENTSKNAASVDVEMVVTDQTGKTVAQTKSSATIHPFDQTVAKIQLPVANPQLWSPDSPTLYQVKTIVSQNGVVNDQLVTQCGFRTLSFRADSGFYLNDKPLKIKGVCNHQDAAGVGVAVPASIWDFRLRKLKEMGVNAYRSAHNPPSTEFLDACDRLGIMVLDENRVFNSSPEYVRQLEWLIRRDRNRPSVILWSVFNEEPMQGTEIGYEMVLRMNAVVKKLDTTRPVTAAMNGGLFATLNVSQAVDVVGFNYQIGDYDRFHQANPTIPLTSSEDVSGIMVRGEYKTDKAKHLLDSYDTQKPSWGATHRVAWKAIAERPFLAGCFVWTGFDYRGEPTPYDWPTAGSNFGIMDICGFPKTAFYLHQAQWVTDKPILQLVPHWNWPADTIGKNIQVMALSNVETIKLRLNGKLISEKPVDKYEMVSWDVPYQPGKLEAIGMKGGKEVARFVVETTGNPVSVQLIPDRPSLNGDGWDAMPVTVQVLDAKGRPVPTANVPIEFEISGSGSIIGLGNGDPNSHEAEKGTKRSLFNGLAQATIQSIEEGTTPITLTAKSPGLKPAIVTILVKPCKAVPSVMVVEPRLTLDKWRMSPFTTTRPDPNQEISDNDMNSWMPTSTSQLPLFNGGRFAVYRTEFEPYSGQQKNGAKIILKAVTGKAEVWVDKLLAGSKTAPERGDLTVTIPARQGKRTISVLVESEPGLRAGLGGVVTLSDK